MTARRPLGHVLVATDFSGMATSAVERAARLPLGPGAVLTVLHVLRPGSGAADRAEADRALQYAVSAATTVVARAGRADVTVRPCLAEGAPAVEIVEHARQGRNELVVVGRHGGGTLRGLLLGSTAERVVRNGDTSVLVVANPPGTPYRRPLVAVDCSNESRPAMELAWRLADAPALDVVHAYDPAGDSTLRRAEIVGDAAHAYHVEARERVEAGVKAFLAAGEGSVPTRLVVREGDPGRAILDTAVEHDCDLLAVGTRGRSGLARLLLLGSVAEGMVRAARCDVVVARAAIDAPARAGVGPGDR